MQLHTWQWCDVGHAGNADIKKLVWALPVLDQQLVMAAAAAGTQVALPPDATGNPQDKAIANETTAAEMCNDAELTDVAPFETATDMTAACASATLATPPGVCHAATALTSAAFTGSVGDTATVSSYTAIVATALPAPTDVLVTAADHARDAAA